MKMAMMMMMMLPLYLPWLTSSLLTPSITSCALGKRLLARTHLMSEAEVAEASPLAQSPSTLPLELREEEVGGKKGSSNRLFDFRCSARSFL